MQPQFLQSKGITAQQVRGLSDPYYIMVCRCSDLIFWGLFVHRIAAPWSTFYPQKMIIFRQPTEKISCLVPGVLFFLFLFPCLVLLLSYYMGPIEDQTSQRCI